MDRRVIMVEPNIRSEDGHYYQNLRAIQSELQARGIRTAIVGCTDSDVACRQLPTFYPVFSHLPARGTGAIARFAWTVVSSWHFYQDLGTVLGGSSRIRLEPYDVLFMNTVLDTQILGWGYFLWRRSSEFKKLGLKFVFLLKFRPTRRSRLYTALIEMASWIAFGRLMRPLREQVVLCTESELVQKEYIDLLNLPIPVLPLPIAVNWIENDCRIFVPPLTITYLGGDVYYKGFDLLVEAIARLVQGRPRQCRFKLQVEAPNRETRPWHHQVLTPMERLGELMRTTDIIELVPESLPTTEYLSLLRATDVFVLPYRSIHYAASTSGVFAEALSLGKIPVVPEGTWMSQELARLDIEGLTFKQGDVEDLARVLGRVIEDHLQFRERMAQAGRDWQSCHNPQTFVDALLARLGWEAPGVSKVGLQT